MIQALFGEKRKKKVWDTKGVFGNCFQKQFSIFQNKNTHK